MNSKRRFLSLTFPLCYEAMGDSRALQNSHDANSRDAKGSCMFLS